ncbi:hypothetical protein RvY_07666-2 [Ramazzottius varieornatus]|uniref:G-protein coupled receptors family 1 profile domain-containing protein n=1 Tax=Ramazzottius varieornatus TaxID=947166 RepID=A0A1D1V805_RAMVA|nr:hypothetical protein RvY_07666-2 [Ramazzottius varieornatus]
MGLWGNITDEGSTPTENNNVTNPRYAEMPTKVIRKVTVMGIFMFFAVVGNSAVLITLFKARAWRRPVSSFIVSLAISDLSIAVLSMTTEVFWDLPGGWLLGNAGCKLLTYIQCILFASTAFIHMSISIDRFEAICKPVIFSQRYLRNRKMIGMSWLMAFVISVPQLFVFLEVESADSDRNRVVHLCRSDGYTAEWQRKIYVTWNAGLFFLLPLVCITFCYSKIACAVWTYDKPVIKDCQFKYPPLFLNSTTEKSSAQKRSR